MKRFIFNSVRVVLILGLAEAVFDQVGPTVAGDYFNLIQWGLRLVSLSVLAFITWRFYAGIKTGYLLFDDLEG